jgi:tetratricopeptide (TPR) repeat protein
MAPAQRPSASPAAPAPSSTPAAPRSAFDDLTRRAERAREKGSLDEAVRLYRQALRLRPSWVPGHWAVGNILYELDEYGEARDAFDRVVTDKPDDGAARAMKGLCEFQQKAYDRALEDLQRGRILGLEGTDAQLASVVAYHVAILLTRSGQYELGFEALREFAARGIESPNIVEAFGLSVLRLPHLPKEAPVEKREMVLLAGHAGMLMANGRRSAAGRASFEELARRFPEVADVHYAFGTYLVSEEPDAAIEEFQRALRLEPGHVPALLQIAFEQIKRGRARDALAPAEKAVELSPGLFAARNALGRALLEAGEVERAVAELETGTRLAPDSPDMYFALARAYQRAGRTGDAERARATFLALAARAGRAGAEGIAGKEPPPPP